MTKFLKGDRVGIATRYGNGLTKQRYGKVVEVGSRGVRIAFDDDGDDLWRPAGTVLFEHDGRLVKDRPATTSAAPRAALTVVAKPVESAPPAVASAIPAVSHRDVLQHMESSGVDLLQLWRGIGESLRERQRAAVTEASQKAEAARREVDEAESLLAEARARLEDALREETTAANALRDVILQTGGRL